MDQLQRELESLHARLSEADRKYHLLNTSSAAERVREDVVSHLALQSNPTKG